MFAMYRFFYGISLLLWNFEKSLDITGKMMYTVKAEFVRQNKLVWLSGRAADS